MSDFVQFLALWAVTAGASIAIGASVRLAVDAWEARERARRAAAEPFTIHGFHKARFASRHMATFAMDTAWTEPERGPVLPVRGCTQVRVAGQGERGHIDHTMR